MGYPKSSKSKPGTDSPGRPRPSRPFKPFRPSGLPANQNSRELKRVPKLPGPLKRIAPIIGLIPGAVPYPEPIPQPEGAEEIYNCSKVRIGPYYANPSYCGKVSYFGNTKGPAYTTSVRYIQTLSPPGNWVYYVFWRSLRFSRSGRHSARRSAAYRIWVPSGQPAPDPDIFNPPLPQYVPGEIIEIPSAPPHEPDIEVRPGQRPNPAVNPNPAANPRPGTNPRPGNRPGYGPSYQQITGTFTQAGSMSVSSSPTKVRRPPGPGERELKIGFVARHAAVDFITDILEFIDAAYDALPDHFKKKNASGYEKVLALYNNPNAVDLSEFGFNLLANEIIDTGIGLHQGVLKDINPDGSIIINVLR